MTQFWNDVIEHGLAYAHIPSNEEEAAIMDTSKFVGKFYFMDPTTEDLIPSSELKDGMVVLEESSRDRVDIENPPAADSIRTRDANEYQTLLNNRFCEVTKLARHGDTIYFIGVYHDGMKMSRSTGDTSHWIVKKLSMR